MRRDSIPHLVRLLALCGCLGAVDCDAQKTPLAKKALVPGEWLFPAEIKWLGERAGKAVDRAFGNVEMRPVEPALSEKRLRCEISLPKTRFTPGEKLKLGIKLTNATTAPLIVNVGQPSMGFQARLFDKKGQYFWGLITRVEGSFGLLRPEHFKRIPPGESLSLDLEIESIADFASPQSHSWSGAIPGEFVLTVVYSNHDKTSYDESNDKPLQGAWTGRVASNSLRIECR